MRKVKLQRVNEADAVEQGEINVIVEDREQLAEQLLRMRQKNGMP